MSASRHLARVQEALARHVDLPHPAHHLHYHPEDLFSLAALSPALSPALSLSRYYHVHLYAETLELHDLLLMALIL